MSKKKLEKHYLDTTYSVFIDKEQYDIKINKPLPAVLQELVNKEKSAVILTAWNPKSHMFPTSENQSRNIELYKKLKEYEVFKAVGQGDDSEWPGEESFFILGINKEEAEQLAVNYGQYAYVWIDHNKLVSLEFSRIWSE